MPKVKIQKETTLSPEKLLDTVQELLSSDKEIKALEPNLKLIPNQGDGLGGKVEGSRVNGSFEICKAPKGSSIDIELSLPLMLSPFKGLVQKKIEDKLSEIG